MQIANLAVFARAVQHGEISQCASDLGLERTTVSRRLGELGQHLGVIFLNRMPRRLTVIREGEACFEQCEPPLEIASKAQPVAIGKKQTKTAEPIVVGAPLDIIEIILVGLVVDFQKSDQVN